MNALWISRLCAYKNSPLRYISAQKIIEVKTERQSILLKSNKISTEGMKMHLPKTVYSTSEILLAEARFAKQYWKKFKILLPRWAHFPGRTPRGKDIANRLLDIGYHHITNKVTGILIGQKVTPAMGIIHSPRRAKSAPLSYDLVELFRADLVDTEVLRFLRLKKKPLSDLNQAHIARFLYSINKRLERKYYIKDFKQCHSYHYYMELQIVKFIKAVNHNEAFEPIYLPSRNETRCA